MWSSEKKEMKLGNEIRATVIQEEGQSTIKKN